MFVVKETKCVFTFHQMSSGILHIMPVFDEFFIDEIENST